MEEKAPSFLISVRFLTAVIAFFGYAVQYIQRIDMSVAIVCMVNNTAIKLSTASQNSPDITQFTNSSLDIVVEDQCLFKQQKETKSFDGPFPWNKGIQGLVLSSFFYGYLTTQIIGGYLSLKFGAKLVLAVAILVGSILTLLIPIAARISYIALLFCRFFTGVAHGAFWPAMSSLWAYWAPPAERSRLVGIANAGAQIGNVVALPLGGFLCVYGFDGGWPSIFYIFGALGIVWFVAWMLLAAKSPSEHRFISERERAYIIEKTKDSVSTQGKRKTPWLDILKSKVFWSLVVSLSCSHFGTYLFLTQLPTYMREILKFDIKSNGGLSALPYVIFWFLIIASSIIGDKLVQSKILSKTAVRKIFSGLGLLLPMLAVIGLCFVNCSIPYTGVALLTFGLATTGCGYGAGFMVNFNDVAGAYAGLVFGMANTVATIPGIIAPTIVGALTTHQLQSEWRVVFMITAVVYLVGAIGFILFGSGEPQPWATQKEETRLKQLETEEYVPLNREIK